MKISGCLPGVSWLHIFLILLNSLPIVILLLASMFCFTGKECLLLQKEQKACLNGVQSYLFGDNIFGAVGTQAFLT